MNKIRFIVKELYSRVVEHNLTGYSAQMAYFFLLSIFPFLILFFAVLGKLQITYDVVSAAYMQVMPVEAFSIIDSYIKGLLAAKLETVLPISLIASLWTASKAVNALERAFNRAHEVPQRRKYIYGRLIGVLVTLFLVLILIIALTLPSMGSNFIGWVNQFVRLPIGLKYFFAYGRWIVLISFFITILSVIYSWLPNITLTFVQVIPGVIFTMVGWSCLSVGFSIFIQYFSNISFIYGSLGTIITLMIWLYFIGILIMFGAEINAVLIKWHEIQKQIPNYIENK